MIRTGISIAWLSDDVPTLARSTIERTWSSLRTEPTWSEWLENNVEMGQFIVVNFEERDARRSILRGGDLSVYVPATEVVAAAEARNLKSYAAELYRDIYAALAEKSKRPAPPVLTDNMLTGIVSRFP